MKWTVTPEDRPRHLRLAWYTLVAFLLAIFGRVCLHFDAVQTILYGVMVYIMLNVLNYRAMFTKRRK